MQFPRQLPLQLFCSCICQKSSKNPWQKSLTKTLQKPHKNLVQQKLLYIFKHSYKTLCKKPLRHGH